MQQGSHFCDAQAVAVVRARRNPYIEQERALIADDKLTAIRIGKATTT